MAGLGDVRWHLELIQYRALIFLFPTTVGDSVLKHAKPIYNAGSILLVVFSVWKFLLPDTHLLAFFLTGQLSDHIDPSERTSGRPA